MALRVARGARHLARPESGAWRAARVAKRSRLPGSGLQSLIVACIPAVCSLSGASLERLAPCAAMFEGGARSLSCAFPELRVP